MASDSNKYIPIHSGRTTPSADGKSIFSAVKPRKTSTFAYVAVFTFIAITLFLAFSPSLNTYSPWFANIFSSSTAVSTSDEGGGGDGFSSVSSIFSHMLPLSKNRNFSSPTSSFGGSIGKNDTFRSPDTDKPGPVAKNANFQSPTANQTNLAAKNSIKSLNADESVKRSSNQSPGDHDVKTPSRSKNEKKKHPRSGKRRVSKTKQTRVPAGLRSGSPSSNTATSSPEEKSRSGDTKKELQKWKDSVKNCDFFDGEWVKDDSYPLYKPGSCKSIDEQFNCILNGRPDKDFQRLKWKPKRCTLPRLNGAELLEMIRGRRLVFVGDSLNRNMWESLVCILKASINDQSKVFEAKGRHHFRGEAEYSFLFKDYNSTVEFYVSPYLVQEWEVKDKDGSKKETLRLDLVDRSSRHYKGADIIVFNTGHWWTHEKTSKGEEYYQEGSHVYSELDVLEAFRKAMTTWARWVDKNVNPYKSLVFFRGYSASHFSGGQWNSGGACDSETEPINNETYLTSYPSKMQILERVIKGMKTHVTYLNITKLTDYRKDGHPSIYRKQSLSDEERISPLRYQDCSHWCLPGVPDSWNEILYAELLVRLDQLANTRGKH